MIDLNEEQFDQKEGTGTVIFNKGVAGTVDNVTLSLTKKKKDDHENAPDYKLNFTDGEGGVCNTSFYYIKEDTQYATVDQQIVKQGKILKHIVHAAISPTFKLPKFNTPKEMLDGVMKAIKENCPAGSKFRIFTNYGTNDYPKKFIQPRSWVPFMESMTLAESRLSVSDLDCLERPAADSDSTTAKENKAKADSLVNDEDWD
jgi:hypothetical protein